MTDYPWITACVPTFRCTPYLRTSVVSLLSQTYPFIRVVVVNDGDRVAPWTALSDISDRRLIRFDLGYNRGPYFSLAVALEATRDDFFLIQDADDWSDPRRVATLLALAIRDRSAFCFSAIPQFQVGPDGRMRPLCPLTAFPPNLEPGPVLRTRLHHHGLFTTSILRRLGGYFAGFRINYDMFLTNVLLLAESVSWTPQPLYWRRVRDDSLTRSPGTGLRSPGRQGVHAAMQRMYDGVYAAYRQYKAGRMSRSELHEAVRRRVRDRVSVADQKSLGVHATRLRYGINAQAGALSGAVGQLGSGRPQ